jgi:uroporphyrinogen-III synthase
MTSQDKRSRILVTRPAAEARETASILEKAGFKAILCPVLETKTLKPSLPRPEAIEAVIVTSKQAIRALAEYEDWKTLRQKPFWCVGESTAIFAQKHGVLSVFSSPSGHALSLTQEIINTLNLKTASCFMPLQRSALLNCRIVCKKEALMLS